MDADTITKLGGTGILGAYGIKLLWSWLKREKQESTLYQLEVQAHIKTRGELESERKLRKETEMELRAARAEHETDRETWFAERDKDRELREELKNEVFALRTEVRGLRNELANQGNRQ